jgi:hypothetical protein
MNTVSKIICEEIRQEANGKFMLLGVYRPDRIANNLPKEVRWKEPMQFCLFAGVEVDRARDSGQYLIRSVSSNGESLMQDIPLVIKQEGDSYVQLPIIISMNMKGAGDISVNIYKAGSFEPLLELARFSVVETD